MLSTGETMSLAEWIIDDTCLVLFVSLPIIMLDKRQSAKTSGKKSPEVKNPWPSFENGLGHFLHSTSFCELKRRQIYIVSNLK